MNTVLQKYTAQTALKFLKEACLWHKTPLDKFKLFKSYGRYWAVVKKTHNLGHKRDINGKLKVEV